jgi:hypothetical protein
MLGLQAESDAFLQLYSDIIDIAAGDKNCISAAFYPLYGI